MSTEVMLEFLSRCSQEDRLGFWTARYCAPVLKGIKISNIMTAETGTGRRLQKELESSSVLCVCLWAPKNREVLLLYRHEKLRSHLEKEPVQDFLRRWGYEDLSVAAVIRRLRNRYARYLESGRQFPHELGVILEYPVEDVEGFIENQGKHFLMERYWKVYHNRERAAALFDLYDQARELAMGEAMAGYPLRRIAVG